MRLTLSRKERNRKKGPGGGKKREARCRQVKKKKASIMEVREAGFGIIELVIDRGVKAANLDRSLRKGRSQVGGSEKKILTDSNLPGDHEEEKELCTTYGGRTEGSVKGKTGRWEKEKLSRDGRRKNGGASNSARPSLKGGRKPEKKSHSTIGCADAGFIRSCKASS